MLGFCIPPSFARPTPNGLFASFSVTPGTVCKETIEEPLPDKLSGGILVILLELPGQECASVARPKVLRMQPAHEVRLFPDLRQGSGREWDGAVLLVFPIVDRKQH
jgi:hypothetical protein